MTFDEAAQSLRLHEPDMEAIKQRAGLCTELQKSEAVRARCMVLIMIGALGAVEEMVYMAMTIGILMQRAIHEAEELERMAAK